MDTRRPVGQVAAVWITAGRPHRMVQNSIQPEPQIGAEFEGVKVPASPFLTEKYANWIAKGIYEKPERKLSEKLVQPGDRIIEMGAGLGFVGGYTTCKTTDTVLRSYEANPSLIPHVEALYAMNGIADRAEVRNELLVADPDAPDAVTFHIHGSFLGSSVYKVGGGHRPKLQIPTAAWAKVKQEFRPDVLIMDIEGAELEFFTHADLSGVRAIIVELHPKRYGPEGVEACVAALTAKGLSQKHHRYEVRTFVANDAAFS